MTISSSIREQVRRRANFACEFCGITEMDAGSQLTIDHYRPKAKDGDDSLDNLVYCCASCNQHKLDYWPELPDDPMLWNPRREPASQHFLELDDGTLHPLTIAGAFTLQRLRLNRQPLIAHRLRKRQERERIRLLTRYWDLTQFIERLLSQQSTIIYEQQKLLEALWKLLLFLGSKK